MNIILTRTKDEHLNVWWEPFATSTPLKPRSNNVKIVSVPQKQLLIHSDSSDFISKLQKSCRTTNVLQKESAESKPLISKKIRKKKLTYFDLTSSSDEDSSDGNKKRPIIKLSSGKKTKSILVKKNPSNEQINTNKKINCAQELESMSIMDHKTNAASDVENWKSKNAQSYDSKNKTLNGAVQSGANFKDISLSSDEDSKIFDETRKTENISKDIILHLLNKENATNNSKNDNYFKHLPVLDGTGKKTLEETYITKSISKKSVSKNSGYNFESLSVPQSRTDYNKSCKSQKRKCKDTKGTINIAKKTRTKKINNKLVSHVIDRPIENSGSLLHTWECKTNLSHQLFSDSKEQELINILDLTSEEVDEKVKNMESSVMQKKRKLTYKSCNSSHPSVNRNLNQNESEKHLPKRKKQNSNKYLISEDSSNESLQIISAKKKIKPERNSQDELTNCDQIQEFNMKQKSEELGVLSEGVHEENYIKNDRKNLKPQKKPKIKTASVLENKNTSFRVNNFLNESTIDNKLRSSEVNNVLSSVMSNTNNNKTDDSNKAIVPEERKKAVNRKKPVFKLLNELSYKESEMGCSVAQGWSINNFKCGIFKLKVKSQMSCRTLHKSSNLGGVLIKGNLRMKIGNKELNLTEGDMVFVPPLTEWLATNIGKCETLFYYWCGRFNT